MAAECSRRTGRYICRTRRQYEGGRAYGRMLDRYPVAPGASKAALGRANALMAAGNTEEAVEAYRQLLMTRPASDEARAADRELRRHYAATHQVGAYAEFIQDVPGYSVDAADLDDLAYERPKLSILTILTMSRQSAATYASSPTGDISQRLIRYMRRHSPTPATAPER